MLPLLEDVTLIGHNVFIRRSEASFPLAPCMLFMRCCHCFLVGWKTARSGPDMCILLVCSFTFSARLSCLHRLRDLTLDLSSNATYGGGLEHLPALQTLTIRGTADEYRWRGVPLCSTTLTGLMSIVRPSPLSLHCMYLHEAHLCSLHACCAAPSHLYGCFRS